MLDSINREQKLYVIKCGNGYSCLGFEYAEKRRRAVLEWLGETVEPMRLGTKKHFAAHQAAMERGAMHSRLTGNRCNAELNPSLIGLEGKRVEVIDKDGNRDRFYVGKSTGWMPCHLEIKRRDSSGGCAAYVPQGAIVRVIA